MNHNVRIIQVQIIVVILINRMVIDHQQIQQVGVDAIVQWIMQIVIIIRNQNGNIQIINVKDLCKIYSLSNIYNDY